MIDYRAAGGSIDAIRRNGYGEGSRTETLCVTVDGEKQKGNLNIEVAEMQYTEEEMQEIFHKSVKTLEQEMLGQNPSLDHVEENLNLITKIPDQPILVEWEIDRYDLINIYGEIDQDAMSGEQEGVLVELKAFMRYDQDETKQALHVFHVQIFPKKLTASEKVKEGLLALIEEKETETFTEEYVQLPDEWEGRRIEFRRKIDYRSFMFLGLGILFVFLLILLEKQQMQETEKERVEQMMRDYPEIVGKLNLLLGAGMTVKNAWKKIVEDYERKDKGIRYAYEEMGKAYREMQSGVLEKECYEHFGKNCGLRSYRKMGVLLSQNLRKGTKGLTDLLAIEAVAAYEERKTRAKRRGEEAGTKLLLPMFLMLGVVLVIVIVPAFLSIRV